MGYTFFLNCFFWWTRGPFFVFTVFLCRPSEDSLRRSTIPDGSPSKDWQSTVLWGILCIVTIYYDSLADGVTVITIHSVLKVPVFRKKNLFLEFIFYIICIYQHRLCWIPKGTVAWDFYGYFLAWMDLSRPEWEPLVVFKFKECSSILYIYFKYWCVPYQTFSEILRISEKDWQLSPRFSNFSFFWVLRGPPVLRETLQRVSILLGDS